MASVTQAQLDGLYGELGDAGLEVREVELPRFREEMKRRGAIFLEESGVASGGFYLNSEKPPGADWSGLPRRFIAIDQAGDLDEKYRITLHEWGHDQCCNGGCACSNPDYLHPVSEAHVDEFVVEQLVRRGLAEIAPPYLGNMIALTAYFYGKEEHDALLAGELKGLLIRCNRNWIDLAKHDAWKKYLREPGQSEAARSDKIMRRVECFHVKQNLLDHVNNSPAFDERTRVLVNELATRTK